MHATSKPAGGGHPSAEATNSDGLLVFSCHPDDDVWEKRTHSDEASLREVFGKVQIVHLHRSRALGEDETVRQIRKVIEEHPGSRVAFNCDGGAGKDSFVLAGADGETRIRLEKLLPAIAPVVLKRPGAILFFNTCIASSPKEMFAKKECLTSKRDMLQAAKQCLLDRDAKEPRLDKDRDGNITVAELEAWNATANVPADTSLSKHAPVPPREARLGPGKNLEVARKKLSFIAFASVTTEDDALSTWRQALVRSTSAILDKVEKQEDAIETNRLVTQYIQKSIFTPPRGLLERGGDESTARGRERFAKATAAARRSNVPWHQDKAYYLNPLKQALKDIPTDDLYARAALQHANVLTTFIEEEMFLAERIYGMVRTRKDSDGFPQYYATDGKKSEVLFRAAKMASKCRAKDYSKYV